jgi:hypothetical protein
VDTLGSVPADEIGQVGDGAGPQRFVPGVARLPSDDRILQVDQAQEEELVAEEGAGGLGLPEETSSCSSFRAFFARSEGYRQGLETTHNPKVLLKFVGA